MQEVEIIWVYVNGLGTISGEVYEHTPGHPYFDRLDVKFGQIYVFDETPTFKTLVVTNDRRLNRKIVERWLNLYIGGHTVEYAINLRDL